MSRNLTFWRGRAVMYRCFDSTGRLLYVGSSSNLPRRIGEHRQAAWWMEIATKFRLQVFPSLEAARAAEALAIQEEEPIANVVGTGRQSHDKSWPLWTKRDHALANEFATRGVPTLHNPPEYLVRLHTEARRELAEIQTEDRYDALENVL